MLTQTTKLSVDNPQNQKNYLDSELLVASSNIYFTKLTALRNALECEVKSSNANTVYSLVRQRQAKKESLNGIVKHLVNARDHLPNKIDMQSLEKFYLGYKAATNKKNPASVVLLIKEIHSRIAEIIVSIEEVSSNEKYDELLKNIAELYQYIFEFYDAQILYFDVDPKKRLLKENAHAIVPPSKLLYQSEKKLQAAPRFVTAESAKDTKHSFIQRIFKDSPQRYNTPLEIVKILPSRLIENKYYLVDKRTDKDKKEWDLYKKNREQKIEKIPLESIPELKEILLKSPFPNNLELNKKKVQDLLLRLAQFQQWREEQESKAFRHTELKIVKQLPSIMNPETFYLIDQRYDRQDWKLYQADASGKLFKEIPIFLVPNLSKHLPNVFLEDEDKSLNTKGIKEALIASRNGFIVGYNTINHHPLNIKLLEFLRNSIKAHPNDHWHCYITLSVLLEYAHRYSFQPALNQLEKLYHSFLQMFPELQNPDTVEAILEISSYSEIETDLHSMINIGFKKITAPISYSDRRMQFDIHQYINKVGDIKEHIESQITSIQGEIIDIQIQYADFFGLNKQKCELKTEPDFLVRLRNSKQEVTLRRKIILELKNKIEHLVGFRNQQEASLDRIIDNILAQSTEILQEKNIKAIIKQTKDVINEADKVINKLTQNVHQLDKEVEEAKIRENTAQLAWEKAVQMPEDVLRLVTEFKKTMDPTTSCIELAEDAFSLWVSSANLQLEINKDLFKDLIKIMTRQIDKIKELHDKKEIFSSLRGDANEAQAKIKKYQTQIEECGKKANIQLQAYFLSYIKMSQPRLAQAFLNAFMECTLGKLLDKQQLISDLQAVGFPSNFYFDETCQPRENFLKNYSQSIPKILEALQKKLPDHSFTKLLAIQIQSVPVLSSSCQDPKIMSLIAGASIIKRNYASQIATICKEVQAATDKLMLTLFLKEIKLAIPDVIETEKILAKLLLEDREMPKEMRCMLESGVEQTIKFKVYLEKIAIDLSKKEGLAEIAVLTETLKSQSKDFSDRRKECWENRQLAISYVTTMEDQRNYTRNNIKYSR